MVSRTVAQGIRTRGGVGGTTRGEVGGTTRDDPLLGSLCLDASTLTSELTKLSSGNAGVNSQVADRSQRLEQMGDTS